MAKGYSFQGYDKERMARGLGRSLPISTKQAIVVCDYMRNKKLSRIKSEFDEVIKLKRAIPFNKFNMDTGHKKGMGPGKYPKKTCENILNLIKSIEANAQFKGLNSNNLFITFCCANKAAGQWHYGRHRGRVMKKTHVEMVVEEKSTKKVEKEVKKTETVKKKVVEKELPKKEEKKVVEKKAEVKQEEKPTVEAKPEVKETPKVEQPKTEEKKEPKIDTKQIKPKEEVKKEEKVKAKSEEKVEVKEKKQAEESEKAKTKPVEEKVETKPIKEEDKK